MTTQFKVEITPVGCEAPKASSDYDAINWKDGPLPPNTYYWGGVVPWDHEGEGFFFCSFVGDHVVTTDGRKLLPHEVKKYNNSIKLPPR